MLQKIIPQSLLYLGEPGISMTEASSRKNENANEVRLLMKQLDADVYGEETTMLTQTGVPSKSFKEMKVLVVSDFSVLKQIAKLNAESALLGIGIKTFNAAIQTIQKQDAISLVNLETGVEFEHKKFIEPRCVSTVIMGSIDTLLAQESVEKIVELLSTESINQLDANLIREGLQIEAAAAVIGKQLAPEAFLRQLLEAKPSLKPVDITTPFALITRTPVIAYTPEQVSEFKQFYDDLQADYKATQGKLNGIKKQLKDAIRSIDSANKAVYKQQYDEYSTAVAEESRRVQSVRNNGETLRNVLMKGLLNLKIKL